MTKAIRLTIPALVALGIALPALAADEAYVLVIQDHRFEPAEITVPAGQRVKLVVENRDTTPEEFESSDLRREKIVPGNGKATIWLGPLPQGEYQFVGEFHESTAQGKLIAQ